MTPPSPGAEPFQQFTMLHGVSVAACAAATLLIVTVGRRLRPLHERRFGVVLALVGFVVAGVNQWWWLRQGVMEGLPLQICDLSQVLAGIALLWPARLLRTMLYFWAFALSTQAFITPVLEWGPPDPRYWLFWSSHTVIVGYAIYDVAVRGYRPGFRDFLIAFGVTVLYAYAVIPLNLALESNYVYTGPSTPGQPTLIDHLGPWPFRLLPLTALVGCAMLLAWLPWCVVGRLSRKERTRDADGPREADGR
ncbi:MAG: TIGR02206 family membrane protein [Planctomycetota bacterium]